MSPGSRMGVGRNFVGLLFVVRVGMMRVLTRPLRVAGLLLAVAAAVGLLVPVAARAFFVRKFVPALYDADVALPGLVGSPGATVVPKGPDGNMWFTTSAGRVARVTPDGTVTEFGHGITDGGAVWLAVGGDGALWFSERGTLNGEVMVGRIRTSGAITEYPSALQSIGSFLRGGDGAVWYEGNCVDGRCLARMDSSGQVSTFTLPVSDNTGPLALGGDGDIWLPILPPPDTTAAMVRVSSTGAMRTFQLPTGVVVDDEVPLVAGPGGGVWFTSAQGRTDRFRLGYITDAGQVTILDDPGPTAEDQAPLAAGPAGELWYGLDTSSSSAPLRLITPTGKAAAQMNGVAEMNGSPVPGPMMPGPDHSLWSGAIEIAHTNRLKPICDVADEVGLVVAGRPLRWVSDGCSYRVHTPPHRHPLRYPLKVYRQNTAPGRHISTDTPVLLQARQAPHRYGHCHIPPRAFPASVILRTATAVVFQRFGDNAARYFACAPQVGTLRPLPAEHLTSFSAAGGYLAFWADDIYGPSCAVTVLNLATGKKTSISTTKSFCPDGRYDQVGPFAPDELTVNATGLVAWIFHDWGGQGQGQLYDHDSTGTHVVDTGNPLDLGSLKFAGNTLHWTNNNTPQQATLR